MRAISPASAPRRAKRQQDFVAAYHAYFKRNNEGREPAKRALDPLPRVALVPGIGLFGMGRSKKDAAIAADIAENTVLTITDAEAIGRFEALPESELFEMEYWSLEQAKLGSVAEKPLAGQVAAITGGAGAIGAACAKLFKDNGAEIAVLDLDEDAAQAVAKKLGGAALGLECDVTDDASVRDAFEKIAAHFGGLDILISNAGAAWQGKIGEVEEAVLRQSFELNFWAHQRVAQAAVKIMLAQGTGGCLLFNVSKQAINPGPDFGPYGLPKAATLFLSRQYALDYGKDGIRANAVNADRIRSGLADTRDDRRALEGARPQREGLSLRQSPRPRGHGRGCGAGLPAPGAVAQDHRRCDDGRWRQHRRRAALSSVSEFRAPPWCAN